MDHLYGLHSTASYSDYPLPVPSEYEAFVSPAFRDRIPIFGSEPRFSATPPAVSDAASIGGSGSDEEICSVIRAKVASHPLFPKLLEAFIDCQKVGATPEISNLLDEIRREREHHGTTGVSLCLGDDPELDEFMATYCDVLVNYKSELERPFDEATRFLNNVEAQLSDLCNSSSSSRNCLSDGATGSSEEDLSPGEVEVQECNQASEDRELKDKLLHKYRGYISSLKYAFSVKKKKGKLSEEARQILIDWWTVHYKWPYPTEADKVSLAESTGLDQKQINNWFINQRKRHWKPSENMQFAVMDSLYGPLFMND